MEPNIASLSKLLADSSRSHMLSALMSGKALTVNELATFADVSVSTASIHIQKLCDANLLESRKQGRHRYVQITNPDVAALLEHLQVLSNSVGITTGPKDPLLANARICYDHLAGTVAVTLFEALSRQQYLCFEQHHLQLSQAGADFFQSHGCDVAHLQQQRRVMCRECLDWSERRSHLAGSLGQWILQDIVQRGWAEQALDSRAVVFSDVGMVEFKQHYQML